MSVIKKSFIKIAALMLGVTLVATACDFGQTSSTTTESQSSSSEVSTQAPITSSEISSSTTSSNSTSSVSSSSSSSIIPTLTGISLNTDSVKKEYTYGETLNLAGLVVTASYSNNTTTQVTNYTTNIANGSELKTLGENDIVVTYETFTASFKITVSKVFTGIELDTTNVKKVYGYNESLDLTGLVVKAKFNDNSEAVVTEYTTDPANGTALTNLGENTVTVTYQEKTASFKVTVNKVLESIRVDATSVKKEYYYAETLDLTGLTVYAKYNNNTEEAVTNYTTSVANGSELKTLGENTITVTYETFTAEFKVNVSKKFQGLTLNTADAKKVFTEGDAFETTGLVVTANYNDGFNAVINEYTTEPAVGEILNTVGEVTVKVKYQSATATYKVTVNEALVHETGTTLLLDLGVQPEFTNNVANVQARGTTPKSDYFVNFKLTRNSQANESMTLVNSKLRVMANDVIENTESLHGVTNITVNGGNGNFYLYVGYTQDTMYDFLDATSNGGDRIYENVPRINYFKLVGKYDAYPADILSIEFTYTRDNNGEPVDGVLEPTLEIKPEAQGTFTYGVNVLVIKDGYVTLNDTDYAFAGFVYGDKALFINNGKLISLEFENRDTVRLIDYSNRYSNLNGPYVRTIAATVITLTVDGVETAFNTNTTRKEMKVGDTFAVAATSDALPAEDVAITLVDETNAEVDPYVGTYTLKSTVYVMDIYYTIAEFDLTINPIVISKVGDKYKATYSDVATEDYPGVSGTFDATVSAAGNIRFGDDNLDIVIDTTEKKVSFTYVDEENAYVYLTGDMGYTFSSTSKPTASLKNGVVTATNAGDFYLDFKTTNGLEEKYYVTVVNYVPAELTVTETEVAIKVGETYQIEATVTASATDKTIDYKSQNEAIVTVDNTGLVSAVSEGEAIVTVTTADDVKEVKFTVSAGVATITTTTYTFDDDNGETHTVVVVEGTSLTIDDAYTFTYDSGLFVYDADDDIIVEIRISGSQAYLGFVDEDMDLFGYYGPITVYSENEIFLTFVSKETTTPTVDPTPVVVVKQYLFEDQDGGTHALVVTEEVEAVLDDNYHFTYTNGHYVYDEDADCYFDIRHSGQDLLDYYDTNMTIFGYYNYIVTVYTEEGTLDLVIVD